MYRCVHFIINTLLKILFYIFFTSYRYFYLNSYSLTVETQLTKLQITNFLYKSLFQRFKWNKYRIFTKFSYWVFDVTLSVSAVTELTAPSRPPTCSHLTLLPLLDHWPVPQVVSFIFLWSGCFWLNTILATRLPVNRVSNFKNYYFSNNFLFC